MPQFTLTVAEIATALAGRVEGDPSVRVEGIAALDLAGPTDLTFAADEKRAARLPHSRAAAALVGKHPPAGAALPMPLIRVDDVQEGLARFLAMIAPPEDLPPLGVHSTADVHHQAQLGEGVAVGPHVSIAAGAVIGPGTALCAGVRIGRNVRVGAACVLHEGVVVKADCTLGDRVRLGANSVIGQDGFGYYTRGGVHHKVPHVGTVVVEDDVEIGACACVDRAKFGVTRVGTGTKIDNLVQVAHNVEMGRGCLIAGLVGIAGSAKLGDYVVLGGHAGIRDNTTLGSGVQVTAFGAIAQDVPSGEIMGGIPARPAKDEMRVVLALPKLPDLIKRVKELEAKVQSLESAKDHS